VRSAGYHAHYTFRGWTIEEEVPYLDVSAALTPDERTLTLAVVNRHPDASIDAELRLVGMRAATSCTIEQVGGAAFAVGDCNTLDDPDRVGITRQTVEIDRTQPRHAFAPRSLTMLTIPVG
jgi:alpha-L-arabinofuranosidase